MTDKAPSHVLGNALIDATNSVICKMSDYERRIGELEHDLKVCALALRPLDVAKSLILEAPCPSLDRIPAALRLPSVRAALAEKGGQG